MHHWQLKSSSNACYVVCCKWEGQTPFCMTLDRWVHAGVDKAMGKTREGRDGRTGAEWGITRLEGPESGDDGTHCIPSPCQQPLPTWNCTSKISGPLWGRAWVLQRGKDIFPLSLLLPPPLDIVLSLSECPHQWGWSGKEGRYWAVRRLAEYMGCSILLLPAMHKASAKLLDTTSQTPKLGKSRQ